MPQIEYNGDAPKNLAHVWGQMQQNKGDVEKRCEQYAMWTIPYICPEAGSENTESKKGNVAIGASLVNSLANRIVNVMFPMDRPFFSLPLTPEANRALAEEAEDEVKLGKELLAIRQATEAVAEDAVRKLNLTAYRPIAVEAAKHAIITGGCIIRRHEDDTRTLYGIKDHVAHRDLEGKLIRVLLRDRKTYASLGRQYQEALDARFPGKYKQDADIELYSYFEMVSPGKWIGVQGLDDMVVMETYDTYDSVNLPMFDITWNLSRGDHYPRGLVEDNAVLFHNIDVVTEASLDMIGIMSDVKFFVNPASVVSVDELTNSARGSYHAGTKDDISSNEFKMHAELQSIQQQIAAWERQLAQVFLLMSAVTRDAERVTAEEIRAQAAELESAFGGLYSKLSLSWQKREAEYILRTMDLDAAGLKDVDVVVTTGLESLSREGQLQALRRALADLQLLETVPEDVRGTIDRAAFVTFIFTNHGVNFGQFVLNQDQIDANTKAQQDREDAVINNQAAAQAAARAATQ